MCSWRGMCAPGMGREDIGVWRIRGAQVGWWRRWVHLSGEEDMHSVGGSSIS